MYTNDDSTWKVSLKGNLWCKRNGIVLVVGKHKSADTYWARRGESFVPGRFPNESAAKYAAEHGGSREIDLDEIWGDE